jgi:hypothetical protein
MTENGRLRAENERLCEKLIAARSHRGRRVILPELDGCLAVGGGLVDLVAATAFYFVTDLVGGRLCGRS